MVPCRPLAPVHRPSLAHERLPRWAGIAALLAAVVIVSAAGVARAEDAAAIEEVTKLNKRALEEYENLNFDKAKKTLNEALEMCTKSGLDDHPIKARTYVHLGVVTLGGGTSERDEAIKLFQKALAIQSDIKLTTQVANPEVQAAFDEAVKSAPPPAETSDSAPLDPSRLPDGTPAPASEGLSHDPVTSAVRGRAIAISVTTDPSLDAKDVLLSHRAAGRAEFSQMSLKEYSPGNWSGSIPEGATAGPWVAYTLSVTNAAGEVIATQGTPAAPMVVRLAAPARTAAEPHGEDEGDSDSAGPAEPPSWLIGMGAGTGLGWATGYGDLNVEDRVTSAFGSSKLHVLPEVGYFLSRDLVLSLQVRLQFVSGATPVADPSGMMCQPSGVCQPAKGAFAALARATWLFGDGVFGPYLSGVLGAGQIRHLATIPGANVCGADPTRPEKCVDTVAAGAILVGGGAGIFINPTSSFGLVLGVTPLIGFPTFTFHVDFNGGVVVRI